jgi:hypothetical protein
VRAGYDLLTRFLPTPLSLYVVANWVGFLALLLALTYGAIPSSPHARAHPHPGVPDCRLAPHHEALPLPRRGHSAPSARKVPLLRQHGRGGTPLSRTWYRVREDEDVSPASCADCGAFGVS